MKLTRETRTERVGSGARWGARMLAVGALAAAGCGEIGVDNMIPMPGKRDGGSRDAIADLARKDAALDAMKADSRGDGRLEGHAKDLKGDGKGADSRPADSKADGCVAVKSQLGCSNSFQAASGWVSLGQTLDIKDTLSFTTVMRIGFEGVESHNGTTSAIVSLMDSCGKTLTKIKVPLKGSVSAGFNGQMLDISAEEINVGMSIGDAGLKQGSAKLSVKVPCNLDGGTPDLKGADAAQKKDSKPPADSKPAADKATDSKPKADSSLPKPDAAVKSDYKVADLQSADWAGWDSKKPDSAQKDAAKSDSSAKPDAKTVMPDSKAEGASKCAGVYNELVTEGVFQKGADTEVGGYYLNYKAYTPKSVVMDIKCASTGAAVASGEAFIVGKQKTLSLQADGKKLIVTVLNKNTFRAVASVEVDDL
ncbi:MAG: hypothetical protein AB1529_06715 [Candidatus Micrarchaeota archaeon]